MATLTTDEKTYIRLMIGDTDSAHLSDANLQYFHDNDAGSNIDKTIYYAITALMGIASERVAKTNNRTGDTTQSQQWFEHLERLEKRWGAKTGLGGSVATIGTINLGIDEEDSTFDIT